MTDFAYDKLPAAAPAPVVTRKAAEKSIWRRIFDGMVEARMREAERLVKDYRDLRL